MTKRAIKILKRTARENESTSEMYKKQAAKSYKKADIEKAQEYMNRADGFYKRSAVARLNIADIKSGTLKAGKNFVTNSSYSTNLLMDAVGLLNISTKHRIDYDGSETRYVGPY